MQKKENNGVRLNKWRVLEIHVGMLSFLKVYIYNEIIIRLLSVYTKPKF